MGMEGMVRLLHALAPRVKLILCHRVLDLALAAQHPKRTFIRRAVEFEVRLAYHERILKTLPGPMQDPDACVIADQAPTPAFEYEDPCKWN
jgi:hypothetical protein